ncbi:MAG: hypothetical protein IPF48_00425 [Sphingomonadales bacterium]|nr:hypothetical protein [Sphingomonadales bacterium]
MRFEDFAQFDIAYDGLRYGTGLTWSKEGSALERVLQDRRDAFRSVKVCRADLMRYFLWESADVSSGLARAMMTLRPAILEGKGAVIGLDEGASLLAYGKPSNDAFLTNNQDGKLNIMMANGEPLVFNYGTDLDWRQTNLLLHAALTSGDLPSYVVADDSIRPIVVPRYYWNQIPPTYADPVFKGVDPADPGIGTMILLSRSEFEEWRASLRPAEPSKHIVRVTATNANLPRLSDAMLHKWFSKLSDADKERPQETLLAECKKAHPKYSIARQRIRNLTPNRTRGPKPFGRKATA